jgi:hypothetical protein
MQESEVVPESKDRAGKDSRSMSGNIVNRSALSNQRSPICGPQLPAATDLSPLETPVVLDRAGNSKGHASEPHETEKDGSGEDTEPDPFCSI